MSPATDPVRIYSSGTQTSSCLSCGGVVLLAGQNNSMTVASGGTATEIFISSGGRMIVSPGAVTGGINVETSGSYSGAAFCSGNSKWYGAGICNTMGTVLLSGGTFLDNAAVTLNGWAGNGGAMEAYSGTLNVSSSYFKGNTATGGGGALLLIAGASASLASNTFIGNSGTYGGGIQNNRASLRASDCIFSGNTSPQGGALENHNGASATLVHGEFYANSASSQGGAVFNDIYSGSKSVLNLCNCVFSGNSAPEGGAIYNTGVLTVSGGSFLTPGDTVYNAGSMTLAGKVSFGGALVTENTISASGAEIVFDLVNRTAAMDSILTDVSKISGASYSVAVVAGLADGAYRLASNAKDFNSSVSVTVDGVASGIVLTSAVGESAIRNRAVSLTLTGDTLFFNYETRNVQLYHSSAYAGGGGERSSVTLGTSFAADRMDVYSGGKVSEILVAAGGTMTVAESASVSGVTVTSGGVYSGGGIHAGHSAIYGGGICNTAGEVVLSNAVFTTNSAVYDSASWTGGYGGAVQNYANGRMSVSGGTFSSNSAQYGGALADTIAYGSPDSVSLAVSKTLFEYNRAAYGGGVYLQAAETDRAVFESAVFQRNSASYAGGALCNCYGLLSITGGTYSSNSAGNDGGAIANWNNAEITSAVFDSNSASLGGAFSNSWGNTANIANSFFVSNTASDGGAVYNDANSVSVTISDSVFEGNTATRGGAVFNASSMRVNGCSFRTESDSVWNSGTLTFSGVNTFAATVVNSGTVVFDVANALKESVSIVNDFSLFEGGAYAVSAATSLSDGVYHLASNAVSFSGAAKFELNGMHFSNALSLSRSFAYGGKVYGLELSSGTLGFSVSTVRSSDCDANGRADTWLLHDAGFSGAFLTGEDLSVSWKSLSTADSSWTLFGAGSTSAGKKSSDLYLYNAKDNSVGAWVTDAEGGVRSWSSVWTLSAEAAPVALGDFNGDGVSDLLLKTSAGDIGFLSGADRSWKYFQSVGSEWSIAGAGDLNGDGVTDVILHNRAGYAGTWLASREGSLAWADLDTLRPDWTIAGSGDFNGDGMDDVLLRKGNYVGAWLCSSSGRIDSWMGLGELSEGTVVEQIADYNGDGTDDLRIRSSAGDIGVLCVAGEDRLSWNYFQSVGSEWKTSLASLG